MNPTKFYSYIYSELENVTPLITDCGRLCGGRCCISSDEGEGMYLYPFEESVLKDIQSFAQITDSDFIVSGNKTRFFSCEAPCKRDKRPLACRIFPLVPYISPQGKFDVIFDPRALSMCPLSQKGVTKRFYSSVKKISRLLLKTAQTREYVIAQSRLIDDFVNLHKMLEKDS